MAGDFAATVGEWATKVKGAETLIFQMACDELAKRSTDLLTQLVYDGPPAASGYKRTGFLRASLVASKEAMPGLTKPNPGAGASVEFGPIEAVIGTAEIGDTVYLGYTAEYGAFVHYGVEGVPPRPWVQMAAQKWQEIVAEAEAKVMQELGLNR